MTLATAEMCQIDFQKSNDDNRTVVRTGFDGELDKTRHFFDGIDSLLSEIAQDIAQSVPVGLLTDLNVVYFPQIGFLISMQMDPDTGRPLWDGSEADRWENMFSSENSVYYKNERMRDMDREVGDVWNDICGSFCTHAYIPQSEPDLTRQGD